MNIDLTKVCKVKVEGINHRDHPDYVDAYIADAWLEIGLDEFNKTSLPTWNNGFKLYRQLSETELDWLNEQSEFVFAQVEKAIN